MKNKRILIIIISISLLIIYLIILVIALLSKVNTYTATVTKIDDNSIVIEDDTRLIPYELCDSGRPEDYGQIIKEEDKYYVTTKERIYLDGVLLLDTKSKKITNSSLNVGDKIYIVTFNMGHKDISSVPPILFNVKLIKVLENAEY